jgi:acetyltransferase-like isoleucine patch superfamily enzyme
VGYNSELILGNNMWITGNCLMIVRKYVEFKNNAVLAWNVTIMDHDAHNIYDISSKQLINEPEPVIVGNHTWVGCNVAILKGSYIPDNSIVGAGSVITKKPRKENSIFCGNPAVEVKTNIFFD